MYSNGNDSTWFQDFFTPKLCRFFQEPCFFFTCWIHINISRWWWSAGLTRILASAAMRKRRVAPPAQRAASTAHPTGIDSMCSLMRIDFKDGVDFHFYISCYDRHLTISIGNTDWRHFKINVGRRNFKNYHMEELWKNYGRIIIWKASKKKIRLTVGGKGVSPHWPNQWHFVNGLPFLDPFGTFFHAFSYNDLVMIILFATVVLMMVRTTIMQNADGVNFGAKLFNIYGWSTFLVEAWNYCLVPHKFYIFWRAFGNIKWT